MTITSKDKNEAIRNAMDGYPEAGSGNSLKCIRHPPIEKPKDYRSHYAIGDFIFIDEETGKEHKIDMAMLLTGLDILTELVIKGKYKNYDFAPLGDEWDGLDSDALVQCAIFGEIIYG